MFVGCVTEGGENPEIKVIRVGRETMRRDL